MAGEFVVVYDLLPEIAAKIESGASKVVRKSAFLIQRAAQEAAPVDTGFLKNSIYVVTHTSSNYESAQRKSSKKSADAEMLPEVEAPVTGQEAYIAVGASYGIFVEFGSIHGPPRPFLTPAVELIRPEFEAAVALLATSLGVDISGDTEVLG